MRLILLTFDVGELKILSKKKALYFCEKWKEIYDTERF